MAHAWALCLISRAAMGWCMQGMRQTLFNLRLLQMIKSACLFHHDVAWFGFDLVVQDETWDTYKNSKFATCMEVVHSF